jgi:hypothetical protein
MLALAEEIAISDGCKLGDPMTNQDKLARNNEDKNTHN